MVAEPLVTDEELSDFPGYPFSEGVLESVAAQVRDLCNWHIAPVVEGTVTVRSRGGTVLVLPSLRVEEVLSVEDAATGDPVTGYVLMDDGTLERDWPFPKRVRVTLRHGFAKCPPALLRPIADEAAAVKRGGRVTSESLQSRSVSLASSGSSLTGKLAGPVLARYTVRGRP